jgi:hypothetical protein
MPLNKGSLQRVEMLLNRAYDDLMGENSHRMTKRMATVSIQKWVELLTCIPWDHQDRLEAAIDEFTLFASRIAIDRRMKSGIGVVEEVTE